MSSLFYRGLLSPAAGGGGGGGGGGLPAVDTAPPALGGGSGCRLYVARGYGMYSDSLTTLITTAGQTVHTWKDYSGSGNHLTQTVSGGRPPVSSNATLSHDGTDLYMNFPSGVFSGVTDGEVFFLLKIAVEPPVDGSKAGSWFIGGNDNGTYPWTDSNILEGAGTSGRYSHASPGGLTTWHVYSVRTSGTDWQSLKNNTAIDTRTGNTVSWGASQLLGKSAPGGLHFNGEFGAVVVYAGARSSGERASIVSTLLGMAPP